MENKGLKEYIFSSHGVCCKKMTILIEEGTQLISGVVFEGGCKGWSEAVRKMLWMTPVDEVIKCLKGIKCGLRDTSCPDQLAKALEECVKDVKIIG